MSTTSEFQLSTLESVFYCVRKGKQHEITEVVEEVDKVVRSLSHFFATTDSSLQKESFELGVATTFAQLLVTAEQRASFNDAVTTLKQITGGEEILAAIDDEESGEGIGQVALAKKIGIDPANFNRRLQKLKTAGLIVSHRRGKYLSYALTGLARDVLDEIHDSVADERNEEQSLVKGVASRPKPNPIELKAEFSMQPIKIYAGSKIPAVSRNHLNILKISTKDNQEKLLQTKSAVESVLSSTNRAIEARNVSGMYSGGLEDWGKIGDKHPLAPGSTRRAACG